MTWVVTTAAGLPVIGGAVVYIVIVLQQHPCYVYLLTKIVKSKSKKLLANFYLPVCIKVGCGIFFWLHCSGQTFPSLKNQHRCVSTIHEGEQTIANAQDKDIIRKQWHLQSARIFKGQCLKIHNAWFKLASSISG